MLLHATRCHFSNAYYSFWNCQLMSVMFSRVWTSTPLLVVCSKAPSLAIQGSLIFYDTKTRVKTKFNFKYLSVLILVLAFALKGLFETPRWNQFATRWFSKWLISLLFFSNQQKPMFHLLLPAPVWHFFFIFATNA